MSAENWAFFGDVEMFRDKSDTNVNLEYLWNLQDPWTGGDPDQRSMFNLTTLKTMIEIGH